MATPDFTARTLRRLMASGVLARAERLLANPPPADIARCSPTSPRRRCAACSSC